MSGCVEKKIKSVSNMTVAEFKQYLQMRGVNLFEIAQCVEKIKLPIDPNHEYGNAENAGEKYIIHDMVIEQPLLYDVVNDFTDSPSFANWFIRHF
jgi:hypothetical protein